MIGYNMWFPANLICVCAFVQYHAVHSVAVCGLVFVHLWFVCISVCVFVWRRQGVSVLLDLSQPCLPVCAVVWGLLWLVRVRDHKLFLPECLQLCAAIRQSTMDAVSFLRLQLSTEQNEARNANDEGDSPQAQSQTQVSYPVKRNN